MFKKGLEKLSVNEEFSISDLGWKGRIFPPKKKKKKKQKKTKNLLQNLGSRRLISFFFFFPPFFSSFLCFLLEWHKNSDLAQKTSDVFRNNFQAKNSAGKANKYTLLYVAYFCVDKNRRLKWID
jgi:hypothetical protein